LKKYAYKTAKQDDLWYELTIQAHRDDTLEKNLTVKQIMDTWTLQKGFPVVNVQRLNDSNLFKLSQKWFLLDSTVPSSNINKPKWFVPFSYTTSKQNNFTFESEVIWLKPNQNEGKIRASIRRIIL
jgi:aminopeptidase N